MSDRLRVGDVVKLSAKRSVNQQAINRWGEYWQVVHLQLLHKRNKHVPLAVTELEVTLSPFDMTKKVAKKPKHPMLSIKELDDYDFDIIDRWCFMMPVTNAGI